MLLIVGCAESGIGDGVNPTGDVGGTPDAGGQEDGKSTPDTDLDTGKTPDTGLDTADTSSPQDTEDATQDGGDTHDGGDTSAPIGVDYLGCVLGEAEPWDACADPDILDFGTVMAGDTVLRMLRIDNLGEVDLSITEATIADPNFSIRALTFTQDTPPVSTEVTLPADLIAGASLFLEVSVSGTGSGSSLDFEAHMLEILIDVGASNPETLSVELSGGYGNCATGYYDCDADPSNGCEINLNDDPLNCGACGSVCAADNAGAACVAGQCAVATCDAGFDDCDLDPSNGCEVDLNSLDDCGGCGLTCGFSNASAQCDSGSCEFGACDAGFADCNTDPADGCEVDTDSNLSNCGGCGQVCALSNAQTQCNAGACELDTCLAGWVDLNGDPADGCEYQCSFTSATDAPDAAGIDANCDGIDGDVSRGIFVATTGSDAAAGTMDAPFATLTKALSEAGSTGGLDHIYVATGQYGAQLTLVDGVSIFGGYDATDAWKRNGGATTRIFYDGNSGRKIAVRGDDITSPTTLGMLDIATGPVSSGNGSNYAFYCRNCTQLTIQNSQITSGKAGRGANGSDGSNGGNTNNGGAGGSGSCDGSGWGYGGTGGYSSCGRTGGSGGRGGSEGKHDGYRGSTGNYGSSGGAGGSYGRPGNPGRNGSNGSNGNDGNNGTGGTGGAYAAGYWVGNDGQNGTHGTHGNGGGGGGGGGGQGGTFVNNGAGNGGGGGGGGGCRGSRGTGGQAGGSSFGLFLVNSSGITLTNNAITSGNAGNGGNGGQGGNGSDGGNGGAGNQHCTDEVGGGGRGGNGGDGGDGGHGGGGAGGSSYGIFREATSIDGTLPGTNTIITGQPGTGGTSSGSPGSNGFAASY